MNKPNISSPLTPETVQVLENHLEETKSTVTDTNSQLDQDREQLDKILVNSGITIKQLEALIDNLSDFRKIFKQVAKDSIKDEVAKAVAIELNKIRLENPNKVIIIYKSFWESVKFWKK